MFRIEKHNVSNVKIDDKHYQADEKYSQIFS